MRTDKLTTTFQTVLQEAQSLAVRSDHQMLEPVHVLKAMLEHQGSGVLNIFANAGVNISQLNSELSSQIDQVYNFRILD